MAHFSSCDFLNSLRYDSVLAKLISLSLRNPPSFLRKWRMIIQLRCVYLRDGSKQKALGLFCDQSEDYFTSECTSGEKIQRYGSYIVGITSLIPNPSIGFIVES